MRKRIRKRLALTTFFKVSNKVLHPEPIDKPIFINYENWDDLKVQFFEQRMKSYDSNLSLAEKTKREIKYLNKLLSINENETILNLKEAENFEVLIDRYKSVLNERHEDLEIWFYVGISLLNGDIYNHYENGLNFTEIAKTINNGKYRNESLRPYISETIANTTKSDKNINSRDDGDKKRLIKYCKDNNIEIKNDIL